MFEHLVYTSMTFESKGCITNREYQKLCPDVSAETVRRDLADLVHRDVLLRIGNKRATYYILKDASLATT